ncbi:MAG: threonine aldolase family protein [Actinomycetota bacterium]
MPDPRGRVDLRSDTVTRPTAEMRRAMAEAEVGDDGFGDDPTVNRLQEVFAERVGKEAALFVASGTMANQIALRLLGRPGGLVFTGRRQHIVVREAAAAGLNGTAQLVTVDDDDGTIDAPAVRRWLDDSRVGWAQPCAIFIEDTHGESGGRVWPLDRLEAIGEVGLPVHLDGARLWNAAVASGTTVAERATWATTVTCCVSKGLGAPAGSLLAGPAELIAQARVERKRLGGMMRQVGVLAAAGLVALERVDRLSQDHARAQRLAHAAEERWPGSAPPGQVHTNIVRITHPDPQALIDHLAASAILAVPSSATSVRLVTHADLDDADIDRTIRALAEAP